MQKKRLFIAIPLSTSTAHSLKRITTELFEKFESSANADFEASIGNNIFDKVRFIPQVNWHITVTFLGDQSDNSLPAIADAVKIATNGFEPPEIAFEKISYIPAKITEKTRKARMIWLYTDRASSERIAKIKDVLDTALASRGIAFQREMKLFLGHITLARFGEGVDLSSLPQIERTVKFNFPGVSLDLMESELKKSGAEYGMLQSFVFKE